MNEKLTTSVHRYESVLPASAIKPLACEQLSERLFGMWVVARLLLVVNRNIRNRLALTILRGCGDSAGLATV